ncbi:MAG: hypothetical protein GY874_10610 [Desulfobacteraceae bacterium]|nr:hypothetical protein [Desulfobacteraceae bacterium]
MKKEGNSGKRTIKIYTELNKNGSAELANEIVDQLSDLNDDLKFGDIEPIKEKPAPGTLPIDGETILIIIKITYWTYNLGRSIVDRIKESKKRVDSKANKSSKVFIVDEKDEPSFIIVPKSSRRDEDDFINK